MCSVHTYRLNNSLNIQASRIFERTHVCSLVQNNTHQRRTSCLVLWTAFPSPFQKLAMCSKKSRGSASYMQPFYFTDFSKDHPHLGLFGVFFGFVSVFSTCSTHSVQANYVSCFNYRYFILKTFFQNTKLVWWCPFRNYNVDLNVHICQYICSFGEG